MVHILSITFIDTALALKYEFTLKKRNTNILQKATHFLDCKIKMKLIKKLT